MKLLITGGTGLLGSAIVEQVAGQYEVLAPSRRELDLENGVAVAEYVEKHQPTLCIHAAAQLQIPARLEEVDQHYITNTILKTKITKRYCNKPQSQIPKKHKPRLY